MKIKLTTLIVFLLFVFVQMTQAQSNVLLRLNLEKGAEYHLTMVMYNSMDQEINGQKVKMLQKMDMVSSYKVMDILPDKNYVIDYSFLNMKMDIDVNGQKVSMDSDSTSENDMSKHLKDLTSVKLKLTISPMGKVVSVEGMDELAKMISSNPQLAQAMNMFSNENNFKANFEQYFGYYPEKEVEVGSKWDVAIKMPELMNMELTMHFELAEIMEDQVVLNMNNDINIDSPIEKDGMKINMKMKGTQGGKMYMDRKNGMTGTMKINQKMDMHMKFSNPQTGEDMEIPMILDGIIKVSVVKV